MHSQNHIFHACEVWEGELQLPGSCLLYIWQCAMLSHPQNGSNLQVNLGSCIVQLHASQDMQASIVKRILPGHIAAITGDLPLADPTQDETIPTASKLIVYTRACCTTTCMTMPPRSMQALICCRDCLLPHAICEIFACASPCLVMCVAEAAHGCRCEYSCPGSFCLPSNECCTPALLARGVHHPK